MSTCVYCEVKISTNTHSQILFAWPSHGDFIDYMYDLGSATYSRPALARFLSLVKDRSGLGLTHIMAHSMGNWLTLEALNAAERASPAGSEPTGIARWHFVAELPPALVDPGDVPEERCAEDGGQADQDRCEPAAGVIDEAGGHEGADEGQADPEAEEGELTEAGGLGAADQVAEVVRYVVWESAVAQHGFLSFWSTGLL